MFFNFGTPNNMKVVLEQYIGNTLIHAQQLSASLEILQAHFMNLVQQITNQQQSMKIRMVRWEKIWSQIDQKWKELELYITFQNWEEE